MKEFAYLGAGVVALAFVAVIVGLPLAIHWAIRLNLVHAGNTSRPMFQGVGKRVRTIALSRYRLISLIGLVLVILFGVIQSNVTAEYKTGAVSTEQFGYSLWSRNWPTGSLADGLCC